jgi:hypothetical protein
MSWTTGTQTECLGANSAVGTNLNTFTTAAAASPLTGAAYLPANFFLPSYGIGKSLLVKASGVISTTGTPTMAWGVTANTTQGTCAPANLTAGTAGVLATTGLVTQATVTNVPWELEVLITCTATGPSATAAVLSSGVVKVYTASTTCQSLRMSSSASNPNTTAGFGGSAPGGTQNPFYIELAAACGTSSSSNIFQVYSYVVMGLN